MAMVSRLDSPLASLLDFEQYTPGATRFQNPGLRIGIQKSGEFTLSRDAHRALGSPAHVELLFDRRRQRIAIMATERDNPRALVVSRQSDQAWVITGGGFCRKFGIDFSIRRTLKAERVGNALIASLASGGR